VLPSLLLADLQRLERERAELAASLARAALRLGELESRLDAQARALEELSAELRGTPGR
jgi:hypothetical protein